MNLSQLRSIIRKSVNRQLKEAAQKLFAPKNLSDFRQSLASALEQSGAPADLVDELSDVGYEGGGIFAAVFDAWQNISSEMQSETPAKQGEVYLEVAPGYIRDLIIDIVEAYQDPMNYEPGRRVKKLNAVDLANKVTAVMFPSSKKSPVDMKARELKDMLGLVTDIVEMCGGSRVQVKGNTVTYSPSDQAAFDSQLPVETKKAGLKKTGPDTYFDDITGLTATFGAGTVTVS